MGPSRLAPLLLLLSFSLYILQISATDEKKSYIVYMGKHSHGRNPTAQDEHRARESHYIMLGSLLGSKVVAKDSIFYSYTKNINAFAAVLDKKTADQLANSPNVISVFENHARQLQTTHVWKYMGLENDNGVPSDSLWKAANFAEDVIVATIDSGVWPESQSFSDEGYGPIPSKWRGSCDTSNNFKCNKKLIGASSFYQGYKQAGGNMSIELTSVRDINCHGTLTLSTLAGNFVPGASFFGLANGTAKGGAPRARVAAYKACFPAIGVKECFDSDILAATDAAISDGVDVISMSLGGPPHEFFQNGPAIGSFHAMEHGIIVIAAAGNRGPTPGFMANTAPWLTTVGASSTNRDFYLTITLGNKQTIKGMSLSTYGLPQNMLYPLIKGEDAKFDGVSTASGRTCDNNRLDPMKTRGKIVLCADDPEWSKEEKGIEVKNAGGVGMIIYNSEADGFSDIKARPFLIPGTVLPYRDALILHKYLNSTKNPVGTISKVVSTYGVKPAPSMAIFSARGPNRQDESIMKPDITAPGLNILAAFPPTLSELFTARPSAQYLVEEGTSISCPQVAGIAACLRAIYPKWSPAAIRSAIMTTASPLNNELRPIEEEETGVPATPWAYGAGHIKPNSVMDPGLVYEITVDDYLNYLCARGYSKSLIQIFTTRQFICNPDFKGTDLNYPSMVVTNLTKSSPVTYFRKVKNVGTPGTYVAKVVAPEGVSVTIEPSSLQFTSLDEEKSYKIVFQKSGVGKIGEYVWGSLTWFDGKHSVRSPMAVKLVE